MVPLKRGLGEFQMGRMHEDLHTPFHCEINLSSVSGGMNDTQHWNVSGSMQEPTQAIPEQLFKSS